MTPVLPPGDHGALMDSVYRGQRHIYDATRKFFLFGRDRLIAQLDCREGMSVLELGCGTGRNLAKIGRHWPGTRLYGLDISSEMLKSASARLGQGAALARGDATRFDAQELFERTHFDRVVLSFALSMIPQWRQVIAQALDVLAPGGSLHIVDFSDSTGLPMPLRGALLAWLDHFHVTPRLELGVEARGQAVRRGWQCQTNNGPACYYRLVKVTQPSN